VANDHNDNIRAHALFSFCIALFMPSYLHFISSWRSHLSKQGGLYSIGGQRSCIVSTNYADGRGGISSLGLGDFRQVMPVVSGAGESPSLAASVAAAPA